MGLANSFRADMLWVEVDQEVRITPTGPAGGAGAHSPVKTLAAHAVGSPGIKRSGPAAGNDAGCGAIPLYRWPRA